MSTDKLAQLSAAGVSIWLDDLSRERLNTGNLADLIRDKHVVGVTTNPTIFANAMSKGDAYDERTRELAAQGADVEATIRDLTTTDVRNAADLFRDVYNATNGVDGRVSIEVDPRLAHDAERTAAEAQDLWKTVDRPNLLIKIPATQDGMPAITRTLAEGISVNVTLIFSLERYDEVMDAFLAGLEQAKANGHDLAKIGSVASVFVSRVDTEVDKRLDKIGSPEARALLGKAAIANAQLAYEKYEQVFSSERWQALADAGAHPQRPLWASTSTKNPDYRDVMYVEQLIAPGVVNTMPEATIHAFAEHGEVKVAVVQDAYHHAQGVLDGLAGLGISYDDVIATLEREAVEKFEASWLELLKSVESQLGAIRE
jgi:transaldolase